MLSQQELADRAGVSLFTVQRIERGEGSVRPKTGRAIAGALGVRVEDLLGKAQAPLPDFEHERRVPTLRSWIDLVNRLADRWGREIEEREREWHDAKPAARKARRLSNLVWANEIHETAANIIDVTAEELERDVLTYDMKDVLGLFRAAKRLDQLISRTDAWHRTATEDAPKMAQVYDFKKAFKRMENRIGARAS
jgi:transcriptional regulator with XRE-family HTH domain